MCVNQGLWSRESAGVWRETGKDQVRVIMIEVLYIHV
jgi:hypothetical protein